MGTRYSRIENGLNVANLNNGDIVLIRNKKYPSTSLQRFVADKNKTLWNSVGIVLHLPEMEAQKYLFEISDVHPSDNLVSLLSGRNVEKGIRVVPLADRLSGIKSGSTCGIRKLITGKTEVEGTRVPQHLTTLRALHLIRDNAEKITDQAEAVTWILQKLGVILNPNYRLSLSDLRHNYINKIAQPHVNYQPLELITTI